MRRRAAMRKLERKDHKFWSRGKILDQNGCKKTLFWSLAAPRTDDFISKSNIEYFWGLCYFMAQRRTIVGIVG